MRNAIEKSVKKELGISSIELWKNKSAKQLATHRTTIIVPQQATDKTCIVYINIGAKNNSIILKCTLTFADN